jgi:hypothetical protein
MVFIDVLIPASIANSYVQDQATSIQIKSEKFVLSLILKISNSAHA